MKYTTKTEYGLMCLIYMIKNGSAEPITIRQISGAENYSASYVEKIFQNLRSAGIVRAAHGNKGGYVLERDPSAINLKQVIEALEGETFQVFCRPDSRENIVCTHFSCCEMKSIWEGARLHLDDYFENISLQSLVRAEGVELKKAAVAS